MMYLIIASAHPGVRGIPESLWIRNHILRYFLIILPPLLKRIDVVHYHEKI